ncbi:LPS-assembly protein LptD [Neorhizobium alkalisoli]|uniref:LPS-assembly protein LptD n=1 Tax=Neorhizobium alkalisoli TaxID=528178 RepID=A0A561R2G0_9HYPH|nr:LPS-assembly protein LptD [Neorhizobium alkalisoli]TWF56805.1 LPS-assembly protein [Neorhizobium alkalisoli]
MAAIDRKKFRRLAAALLTGVSVSVIGVAGTGAYAQGLAVPQAADGAKMLLRANELVYNQDNKRVTATGAVQIYYNRYRMVAQRVEYDQTTGRVMATGNIEFIEPSGNRVYADQLDVTDDFGEGFMNSLRVETTDNTRLAAESAERQPGEVMVLNNTVYTACLPCAATPGKAPVWQVKAQRVIRNGQTHTIRLENAQFELFGMSLGTLPFPVTVPDETVERKSGFLFPKFSASDNLGFGVSVPYYHVFSPSMDATLTPTYYSTQGLLVEGEVRNRFENGQHTFRFAGIDQRDPGTFDAETSDRAQDTRLMAASKGDFQINPRWSFGWNVMAQTDNNFARTYNLDGLDSDTFTNDVYLTGLGKRNYFDLHSYYFDVQDNAVENDLERQQAIVYPSLDYTYYAPEPVAGGELSITANLTNLTRRQEDSYFEGTTNRFPGLEGDYSRLTTEAEWKRTFTTPGGLLFTPILAARADGLHHDMSDLSAAYDGNLEPNGSDGRYMVTAGFETRYPILISAGSSSHIIEPIAQVFLRPNEQMAGGLPNEDAQSFVFDATTLFERDKFSGFDRVEGGSRANVGVRYTGSFDNGVGLRGIFGQSYQLFGQNSFATEDLVQAGADSGLETKRSDYVAMAAIDLPQGFSVGTNTRFDEKSFQVRRMDTSLSYTTPRVSGQLVYTKLDPQEEYGDSEPTDVLKNTMSLRINENWSLAGSATYDFANNDIIRRGVGISYADECTIFTLAYTDKPSDSDANDWTISARLSFRTLGDINIGSTKDYQENFRN